MLVINAETSITSDSMRLESDVRIPDTSVSVLSCLTSDNPWVIISPISLTGTLASFLSYVIVEVLFAIPLRSGALGALPSGALSI
jgi:hypothetical protein